MQSINLSQKLIKNGYYMIMLKDIKDIELEGRYLCPESNMISVSAGDYDHCQVSRT